ncbi:hypothetical protein O206_12060 [Ochrobactrum sp. EGD-AQ16]|nr:hypothetical protein O206_12060 [Ochrobactrum sp. EGD-AQ16]
MGRHIGRNQGESFLLMRSKTTPSGQTKADDSTHIFDRVYIKRDNSQEILPVGAQFA